jgi:hypothetical protein
LCFFAIQLALYRLEVVTDLAKVEPKQTRNLSGGAQVVTVVLKGLLAQMLCERQFAGAHGQGSYTAV